MNKVFLSWGFPGSSDGKESALQETRVWSLGWEDPLEEGMSTHSNVLIWRMPWTEEPGGLQFMKSQRVGHNWVTHTHAHTHTHRHTHTHAHTRTHTTMKSGPVAKTPMSVINKEQRPIVPCVPPGLGEEEEHPVPKAPAPSSQLMLPLFILALFTVFCQSWNGWLLSHVFF